MLRYPFYDEYYSYLIFFILFYAMCCAGSIFLERYTMTGNTKF